MITKSIISFYFFPFFYMRAEKGRTISSLSCRPLLMRERERERERHTHRGEGEMSKEKNTEIKKPESGNVELSGCRRIVLLAKMSHETIC